MGAGTGPVLIDILREPWPTGSGDLAYFQGEAWQDQRNWAFDALSRGGSVFADLQWLVIVGSLGFS